ncbi:hypothetical protein [uncultured Shewanella sp.]|uniref:hypothetical protein n=1 Tax=uncultured Shewanella sp. TaxID=173975 RepID=UPI00262F02DE|nr:hypothetical protein [uncultured Shewanella sp.]
MILSSYKKEGDRNSLIIYSEPLRSRAYDLSQELNELCGSQDYFDIFAVSNTEGFVKLVVELTPVFYQYAIRALGFGQIRVGVVTQGMSFCFNGSRRPIISECASEPRGRVLGGYFEVERKGAYFSGIVSKEELLGFWSMWHKNKMHRCLPFYLAYSHSALLSALSRRALKYLGFGQGGVDVPLFLVTAEKFNKPHKNKDLHHNNGQCKSFHI